MIFISDVRTHIGWGEAREEGVLEDMMMQVGELVVVVIKRKDVLLITPYYYYYY